MDSFLFGDFDYILAFFGIIEWKNFNFINIFDEESTLEKG